MDWHDFPNPTQDHKSHGAKRRVQAARTNELEEDKPLRSKKKTDSSKWAFQSSQSQHIDYHDLQPSSQSSEPESIAQIEGHTERIAKGHAFDDADAFQSPPAISPNTEISEGNTPQKSKGARIGRELNEKESHPRRKRFCSYMYDMDFREEDDAYEIVFMIEQIGVTHINQSKSMPYIS